MLSQLSYGPGQWSDDRLQMSEPQPDIRQLFSDNRMVGRGGLEPPTSRLSGVRSNHLSYRPASRPWRRKGGIVQWTITRRSAESRKARGCQVANGYGG